MPYIDEINDGLDLEIARVNERENVLALHVIEDTDRDAQTPFVSRSVAWAFSVEWLSTEDPGTWAHKLKQLAAKEDNSALLKFVDNVSLPLLNVLVARNKTMMKTSDNVDEPDFRLQPSLHKVLNMPKSVADVKRIMEKEPHNAKYWFMTHLLTVLLDRLMWAISQATVGRSTGVPSTRMRRRRGPLQNATPSSGARRRCGRGQEDIAVARVQRQELAGNHDQIHYLLGRVQRDGVHPKWFNRRHGRKHTASFIPKHDPDTGQRHPDADPEQHSRGRVGPR